MRSTNQLGLLSLRSPSGSAASSHTSSGPTGMIRVTETCRRPPQPRTTVRVGPRTTVVPRRPRCPSPARGGVRRQRRSSHRRGGRTTAPRSTGRRSGSHRARPWDRSRHEARALPAAPMQPTPAARRSTTTTTTAPAPARAVDSAHPHHSPRRGTTNKQASDHARHVIHAHRHPQRSKSNRARRGRHVRRPLELDGADHEAQLLDAA